MSDAVNRSGQAYGFLAMTPIKPGEEDDAARPTSRAFASAASGRFRSVPRTHMARFVIVDGLQQQAAYKQRKEEHLAIPTLIFSSNLDGDLDSYLDELAEGIAPTRRRDLGALHRRPGGRRRALKDYLKHNQIDCGFFYAAYGQATVPKVKASLDQRERLMAFATRTQGMEPAELQQAFIEEFAS